MGKKSVKEDKTIYQIAREEAGMTRLAASEALEFISESRIEKIESEKSGPHPEEILAMARVYKKPSLCNYFCAHECPIGQEYVPEVESKNLAQITLEMISSLNYLYKQQERLVEITVDGKISQNEAEDFKEIQEQLEKLSLVIDSLKLWIDNAVYSGDSTPEIKNPE